MCIKLHNIIWLNALNNYVIMIRSKNTTYGIFWNPLRSVTFQFLLFQSW